MAGPLDVLREMQDRMSFLLRADRHLGELLAILRDTHRILRKLEDTVDRLEGTARGYEERLQDMDLSPKRFDRLEEAVLNIERATLSVEAALGALPRALQQRILRERKPPSG